MKLEDVYYNEFDANAAAWLSNLFLTGEISQGVVDERSIKDVSADELVGLKRAHFFAGIGGWDRALSLSPAGPMKKSGPGRAPASPTRLRAVKKATRTPATSGLISSGSSKSDALNFSLANRLRARLSTVGSIEYTQTWKELATPSGRRYWAHTASARTIYVNVSTGALLAGLNTPRATDGSNGGPNQANGALSADAAAAAWPVSPFGTPQASDNCEGARTHPDSPQKCLGRDIRTFLTPGAEGLTVASWPTTTTRDSKSEGKDGPNRTGAPSLAPTAMLAGFPTATATNRERDAETLAKCAAFRKRNANQNTVPLYLGEVAQFAAWATATAMDARGARNATSGRSNPDSKHHAGETLCDQIRGVILELYFVPMGKRVVLAPEFSLWLMGFPEAWAKAAPGAKDWQEAQAALELECSRDLETQSSLMSPPSLFKSSATQSKIDLDIFGDLC